MTNKVSPPLLKRGHKVSDAEPFHHLSLRKPVSQSLPLRISHEGSRLQKSRNDVCPWQQKKDISAC